MAHCRPQASFTDSFEEIFLAEWHFITKLGPQVSPFPVPFFGVNSGVPSPHRGSHGGDPNGSPPHPTHQRPASPPSPCRCNTLSFHFTPLSLSLSRACLGFHWCAAADPPTRGRDIPGSSSPQRGNPRRGWAAAVIPDASSLGKEASRRRWLPCSHCAGKVGLH
jgi:hypothetical protein